MRVLDGVVAVFSGVDGVQPQSETVWGQANRYKVPRVVFVNKMDRTGADYLHVVNDVNKKLNGKALAMQIPVGSEKDFYGIIDVLTEKMASFESDATGAVVTWAEVPKEYAEAVKKQKEKIIERACDFDEELMELFLMGEEMPIEKVKSALRKGVLSLELAPAFCGSAFRNKGVQLLLDAVLDYLPSPLDVPPLEGIVEGQDAKILVSADPKEPFYALVFKVMSDPFVGVLNFVRVYSGSLNSGSYIFNLRSGTKERVSRIVKMHANKREEVASIQAGDIAAVAGMKKAITGDTLSADKNGALLGSIDIPPAVISAAVEPKNKADYEKMSLSLKKMTQEDPSLQFTYDEETGQTVIKGMGELHLEVVVDRLRTEHKVEVVQGALQVAYKETIRKDSDVEAKFIKQSGGRGQYGHVKMKFEPLERGKGFEFVNNIVGGSIPKEFIGPVQKGIEEAKSTGIIGGYQTVGFKAVLYDGSYHDVDSSEVAFKVAGSMAFKNGMAKASPVLLEPVMDVVVETPEEYMGDVMGDLSSRRGRILGMDTVAEKQVITVEVPLGEMFGYSTDLRSMTKGRATYTMELKCYNEVPKNVQESIVAKK